MIRHPQYGDVACIPDRKKKGHDNHAPQLNEKVCFLIPDAV